MPRIVLFADVGESSLTASSSSQVRRRPDALRHSAPEPFTAPVAPIFRDLSRWETEWSIATTVLNRS